MWVQMTTFMLLGFTTKTNNADTFPVAFMA